MKKVTRVQADHVARVVVAEEPTRKADYGVRITAGEAIDRISVWFPPAQLVTMEEFIVRLRQLAIELAAQDRT